MNTDVFLTQLNSRFEESGRKMINDFFIIFSRFEHALKASGFTQQKNNGVFPSWDRFVNSKKMPLIQV